VPLIEGYKIIAGVNVLSVMSGSLKLIDPITIFLNFLLISICDLWPDRLSQISIG